MSAVTVPRTAVVTATDAEHRLRQVLSLNAATSAVTGIAGLVAASWWSERLGVDHTGLVAAVSAGLLVFAAAVAAAARLRGPALRRAAAGVSAADFGWVAGTVAVVASGALTPSGTVVAVVVGVAVLDFALAQLFYRSRLPRP